MTDQILSAFPDLWRRGMCDGISWSNSISYRDHERVGELAVSDGRVTGTVAGLVPHTAQLWVEDGAPRWSCTCSVAVDGVLCGHCAAVADVYEEQLTAQGLVPEEPDEEEEYLRREERLREYLLTLDTKTLVEIVMDQTMLPLHGWRLSERLYARLASATGSTIDLAEWRDRLDRAFATGDYLDADKMAHWAYETHEIVEALDELTDLGQAPAVSELCEYAAGLLHRAADHLDDSLKWLEGVRALIGRSHLRACQATDPEPVALAGRLVELELRFPGGVFHHAAWQYAGLLGTEGLAEYQRLLELRRAAMPPFGVVSREERLAMIEARAGVALALKDPDRLIEVKKHDIVTPDDYCEVASMLAETGRIDEAVSWVERGLATYDILPLKDQSGGLYELLATLHRRRGDAAAAAAALWGTFVARPSLWAYQRLLSEPEIAADADAWRARTVEHLRERSPFDVVYGISVLPWVLAYEGDLDEAWAVAEKDGCDRQLRWLLARGRERAHPEDAIGVYQEEAEAWIATQKVSGYRQAIRVLTLVERAYDTMGRSEDFTAYVRGVRKKHLDKAPFFALLVEQGWGADPF